MVPLAVRRMMSKVRSVGSRAPIQCTPGAISTASRCGGTTSRAARSCRDPRRRAADGTARRASRIGGPRPGPGSTPRASRTGPGSKPQHTGPRGVDQRPADQERIGDHQGQGRRLVQGCRQYLAGLDPRGRRVEPVGHRPGAEEGPQPLRGPGLRAAGRGPPGGVPGRRAGPFAGRWRRSRLLVEDQSWSLVVALSARLDLGHGRGQRAGGMPVSDPGGLAGTPRPSRMTPSTGQMLAHWGSA